MSVLILSVPLSQPWSSLTLKPVPLLSYMQELYNRGGELGERDEREVLLSYLSSPLFLIDLVWLEVSTHYHTLSFHCTSILYHTNQQSEESMIICTQLERQTLKHCASSWSDSERLMIFVFRVLRMLSSV